MDDVSIRTGSMHLEGYYRDNLLDGRMFEYTPSGTTVAQREYRLGKKHGRHELWFKSGRPRGYDLPER